MIPIVKLNCDSLNDIEIVNKNGNKNKNENKGCDIEDLKKKINILDNELDKFYIVNGDYYFTDYDENIPKSFLTYVLEPVNNYYSQDDIIIKCMVMEDFFELYDCSRFKIINEKNNLINIDEIKLIYKNWLNKLKN